MCFFLLREWADFNREMLVLFLISVYFSISFLLQTFNLNDREKKSLLASVGTINKFTAECSVPMASVEIGTKKWNTVFKTPAGSDAAYMKKGKTGELQVLQLEHF